MRAALAATLLTVFALAPRLEAQGVAGVATLTDCVIGGERVAPCRIGYRTFGRLNTARDNAVLLPTPFLARAADMQLVVGPAGMVDSATHFVVAVDAFGNGVSSSPSNTDVASRGAFERLRIADMVDAQRRFLLETFGITRLHGIVGISMGGMQAYEWGMRHPAAAGRLAILVGTPRPGAYDRLLWATIQQVLDDGRAAGLPAEAIWLQLGRMETMQGQTPMAVNALVADSLEAMLRAQAVQRATSASLEDYRSQVVALRGHDISAGYGGDLAAAARQLGAPVLLIYSWDDHLVTAGESSRLASLVGADTLAVPSACGHLVTLCELSRIGGAVRAFLAR